MIRVNKKMMMMMKIIDDNYDDDDDDEQIKPRQSNLNCRLLKRF